jgi:hypothetical protein
MGSESIVQGRLMGSKELELIRLLLTENPHWSRWRLSRALCELWDGRAPNGQIKDLAARTRLLKLEERGCFELPRRRQMPASPMGQKRLMPVEHATEPVNAPLSELLPLEVQELSQSHHGRSLFDWLFHRYHYLSYVSAVGLNLKYLGQTTGRTRQDRWNRVNAPAQGVFVYPLVADWGQQLTA